MAKTKKKEALSLEEMLEQALVPVDEQPYEVPENWCWTRLECINQFKSKTVDPMKNPEEMFELYSVPSSEFDYPEVVKGGEIGSSKQSVEKNDVLLCKINPRINRVWFVKKHTDNCLIASSEWIVVRNKMLNEKYLMWCMRAKYFREYMLSNVSGVGGSLMRAQPKYVISYPIPIPPLTEQQRIVGQIESLFKKLDETKEKLQEVLDAYETRRICILRKAVSGELTGEWRTGAGVEKADWKTITLGECGTWFGGGTPTTSKKEYWDGGTIPWITSKDMKDKWIEDSLLHITQAGVDNSSANYSDKPAVLFVLRSGILRRVFPVCMVKMPFTVNQDLKVLIPDKIQQEYLYWVCNAYEKDIRDNCMKSGTTVESIEVKKLQSFEIPLPTEAEQAEIVRIIEMLIDKEEVVKDSAEEIMEKIEIMKKSILAKAFRGELGTNHPDEESAVELLKQIIL